MMLAPPIQHATRHQRTTAPVLDWLSRLAELRVPARIAEEWSALTGAAVMVVEASGLRGRRLAGDVPSRCLAEPGRERWPSCLPAPLRKVGPHARCAEDRGIHLVRAVVADGEPVAYVVSGELSGVPLPHLERWFEVIGEEMERFLERTGTRPAPALDFPELVGMEPLFQGLREEVRRALGARLPVLVTGESGTGKDLVAWLIHHRAEGRSGPFVSYNCAALPDQLLEGELFGHRRGAYTGADRDKPGLFGVARGGTLFLDEIQQLSLPAQAKLLRVAETGEYMELGGLKAERSDARLVCATNADLEGLVEGGRFRQDLYYRLSVLTIRTPALREVRGDIPFLVRHFVDLICEREGCPRPEVSPGAMGALIAAPWPGNVRQLIHELERALLRCAGGELRPEHLSPELRAVPAEPGSFLDAREQMLLAWEREEIRRGLERAGWNVSRLAREMNVSRRWLVGRTMRFGLRRPS